MRSKTLSTWSSTPRQLQRRQLGKGSLKVKRPKTGGRTRQGAPEEPGPLSEDRVEGPQAEADRGKRSRQGSGAAWSSGPWLNAAANLGGQMVTLTESAPQFLGQALEQHLASEIYRDMRSHCRSALLLGRILQETCGRSAGQAPPPDHEAWKEHQAFLDTLRFDRMRRVRDMTSGAQRIPRRRIRGPRERVKSLRKPRSLGSWPHGVCSWAKTVRTPLTVKMTAPTTCLQMRKMGMWFIS